MQLTRFSDYALRVLIFVGQRPDEWTTIRQISDAYGISRNHLMKVVSFLGSKGYLLSQRGPGGGIRLQVPAESVRLADVIMDAEGGMKLLELPTQLSPRIQPAHEKLIHLLDDAVHAFRNSLNGSSLADLLAAEAGQAPRR